MNTPDTWTIRVNDKNLSTHASKEEASIRLDALQEAWREKKAELMLAYPSMVEHTLEDLSESYIGTIH